jgi:hypothetical protein
MKAPQINPALEKGRARSRCHRQHSRRAGRSRTDDGFHCKQCHAYVSPASFPGGVRNRNHCPYCLWSRHLDLYVAGDRLAACKSPMEPIGLTRKITIKKYGSDHGELMLIHLCTECNRVSINRIAADDDPESVFNLFKSSFQLDIKTRSNLEVKGIRAIPFAEGELVRTRLFGQDSNLFEFKI